MQAKDKKGRKMKYVRQVEGFLDPYWCDACRMFTADPERHRHGDPIY